MFSAVACRPDSTGVSREGPCAGKGIRYLVHCTQACRNLPIPSEVDFGGRVVGGCWRLSPWKLKSRVTRVVGGRSRR
jgi:hypothetical protein